MPASRSVPLEHPLEFAGYDLVRCLGRGGMGEVWSVVRRGLYDAARPLAIKVLLPELSDDVQFQGIFIREGRISMQLSSANIVPVIELGLHEGFLFMVMERVDGVNLAEFQRRSRNIHALLPLDVVGYIIGEILSALFAAHEHIATGRPAGVIHRDVKPGNILISSTGDVRLIDFGIARPLIRDASRQMPNGTWRYMAPEQARGFAERASDLFAVGVILHELLSGVPFRAGGLSTETYHQLAIGYDAVPALEHNIPPELERLRQGLLEPDPRRRFRSAAEAMQCLSEWLGFGFARLKVARIYENAVGTRSSGFTDAHLAAPPSFLLHRKSSITRREGTPSQDNTVLFRQPDEEDALRGDDEVDEDAETNLVRPSLCRPWLRRVRWMSQRQVSVECAESTKSTPVVVRRHPKHAGLHPVAVEPPALARRAAEDDGGQSSAITPTLRLVLPVDQAPIDPVPQPKATRSVTRAGKPPAPTVITPEVDLPEHDAQRDGATVSGSIDTSERTPSTLGPPKQAAADDSPEACERQGRAPFSGVAPLLLAALVGAMASWAVVSTGCSTTEETRP